MMEKDIFLPALTGKYGNWRYFEAIITADLISKYSIDKSGRRNYFIKTVPEVREIYSSASLNNMLQRVLDPKRLEPIVEYLSSQNDRYLNNLTIAFFDGDPEWLSIDLSTASIQEESPIHEEAYWDEIEKRFGIIRLTGKEQLFVLDGQHRVASLRIALENHPDLGKDEIGITLISHKNTEAGKERTRRLFTTINRYAKPVAKGEYILLDEDDLSAILTRKIIEEHPLFTGIEMVALSKGANLKTNDYEHLTSVVTIYDICEKFIPSTIYPTSNKNPRGKPTIVRTRPADGVIEMYKAVVFTFWDWYFTSFPLALSYSKNRDFSSRRKGGEYYIRPIGQLILASIYKTLAIDNKNTTDLNRLTNLPASLLDSYWAHVLYNPVEKKMKMSQGFARSVVCYSLGILLSEKERAKILGKYRELHEDQTIEIPTI